MNNNRDGLLIIHQGWTDIVNCLALINYYCRQYNALFVYMRPDAKHLINFYIKSLTNVKILYCPIGIKRIKKYLVKRYPYINKAKLLGIGRYDNIRNDSYKYAFCINKHLNDCFVKKFYVSYDIPYMTRIDDFNIERDYELENKKYEDFILEHGTNYVLCHNTIEDYNSIQQKKYKNENISSTSIVKLSEITTIFFDMIKVLENAKEIHVIDSVWASIIYHLNAKYNLFENKTIYLYAKRGYIKMFSEPIKLDNWILIF